jgi:predicted ATP-grasp superfamily ATP-dependent carboligase
VIYTGGLENAPAVVGELARRRPLWGNHTDVLDRVRTPATLWPALAELGVPVPRQIPPGETVPAVGRWLRKADRSSGGSGVRVALPGEPIGYGFSAQEWVEGPAMSAQFVGTPDRTVLLGVTDQLVGESWLHAGSFAYCGNVGPVSLPDDLRAGLSALGEAVGRWGGLRGLWGVDFILHDGRPYLVDLNPRYTAALEILEHACGSALMASHVAASELSLAESRDEDVLPSRSSSGGRETVTGKAIYFAPHAIVFPPGGPWDADLTGEFDPWRRPGFADIPSPGEEIEAGSPVLTFFAADSTPARCRAKLEQRAAELDRLFRLPSARAADTVGADT